MRDLKKPTNSLETRRIRKILNEEARLGISPNSESDSEEVDLQKELYPLGHYINNREEMIEQMFSIIKGAKLRKMLPPILKEVPLDELKADCLIHLLGMSKKRIRAILDGKEINSSSDSESHSDGSSTPKKKPKLELKPFVIKQEGCSDISDNSEEVVLVDPDLDFLNLASNDSVKVNSSGEKKRSKRKLKRKDQDKKIKQTKSKVIEEVSDSEEVQQIDSSVESASENEVETEAPKEGKTLLEILELEMRARAIRALLKNNDPKEGEEPKTNVETQNSSKYEEKSDKHLKEGTTEKITPAKNFRKKKKKNDDVIVITPKVVTIDLTDENEQISANDKEKSEEENSPSSSQNNSSNRTSQEDGLNDKQQTDKEANNSSMVDETATADEEGLKANNTNVIDLEKSCTDEKSSKVDESLNKSAQPEQGKSNWAQRWLESKEVKKVVSTSKICGNIRKKIKSAKLAKKQTPIQDEPVEPSPAPQKEIEGSVVEYELLSKSKTAPVSEIDRDDKDITQASTSQEPTSTETDASTADQVQDVSSTRAENISTSLAQDNVNTIQNTDDETININKPGESISSDTVTDHLNVEEEMLDQVEKDKSLLSLSDNDEVSRIDLKSNNDDTENLEIVSSIQRDTEDYMKQSKDNVLAETNEVADSEVPNTKTDECHGSTTNDVIIAKDVSESHSLITVQPKNKSEKKDEISKKNLCQENKELAKIESENFVSTQEEPNDKPIAFDNLENKESHRGAKQVQELNELETLEINITDEDRDIEDVMEEVNESQSKDFEDTIILVD